MSKTWLLLDCNYLAWRAFYSTGNLSHNEIPTGVTYGFLRDIIQFQETLGSNHLVFCFDCGPYLRERDYPDYKANRVEQRYALSYEQKSLVRKMEQQFLLLRKERLFDLGFRNICYAPGYEADDVIASICLNLPKKDDAIIVGSDKDFYQLLGKRVILWDPNKKRSYNELSLSREYGVSPPQWIDVKAIAGCKSDGIVGIKGVGEVTASKFLTGKLKNTTKVFRSIVEGNDVWNSNRHLVKLPYAGCPNFKLVSDSINRDAWRALCDELGIRSLRDLV